MKYASMIARFNNSIWCATESTVKAVSSLLHNAANGMPIQQAQATTTLRANSAPSNVGVIRIWGVIGRHLSALETACGGVDVDQIWDEFDAMLSDPNIDAIVLDIDSPGGVVSGVPELAFHIRNSPKPVFAWTGGQMSSAAYYIASSATYVSMSPSASAGSVGVYMAWMDSSKRMEREGDQWVIIQSGTEKAFGFDGNMNDKARATLQEQATRTHENFKQFVLANREVSDEYLQGMAYDGAKALEIGLVDGLHATINDLLKEVA